MKQPIYIDNTTAQNKIINSTGNQIIMTLPSAINLDRNKTYEIGLTNASVVYCNPNVINRYLRFTYMSTDYNIQFPNGLYSLNDINLQFVLLTSFLFANGLFYVEGIEATSQCIVYCNDYANTQINFQSNNDNIFDVLGFVSTTNKFIPQSITQYALSPNKVSLNNISNFFISVDIVNSYIQNGLRNNIIHVEPISVSPSSTQVIQPLQIAYLPINKNSIIDQITVTLLGDNNSTIDMTGGTSTTNMQKFSVTLLLQDIKINFI